jgi:LmbE family N-acetylglucosaminyl deacetylase
MSTKALVVAPHPDDETLGCGGTVLRHVANGDTVHWLIVTDMRVEHGYGDSVVAKRQAEIRRVAESAGFAGVHNLGFPPGQLDVQAKRDLVVAIGDVVREVSPTALYVPFRGDVHSDHAVVFDAVAACSKWFRYPSIRSVLCYETLSETDFGLNPEGSRFAPNWFVDITEYLERKVQIAEMYKGELDEFPFPRSATAIRALASVRGAACGCRAAESFMLLRGIDA